MKGGLGLSALRESSEEGVIVRVHPEILRGEGLPPVDEKTIWCDRYRAIVGFERHLYDNGTRIIKFYLHLSKEEQRKRFLRRIDEPQKTGNSLPRMLKSANTGTST